MNARPAGFLRALGLAIVAALMSFRAGSANEAGQTIGVGVNLCAQFSKAYEENGAQAEAVYWPWATGMMSGLNFASIANSNVFRDLTGDQGLYFRAVVSYCKAHPLATYSGAILDLYVSFPLKKTVSNKGGG
jgi:hypothetical protein